MAQRPRRDSPSAPTDHGSTPPDDGAPLHEAAMAALQREVDALTPEEQQHLAAMIEATFGGGQTH